MPNTEPMETMDATTARRVEQEKITRRATLRKLGFGAGLAAFSLLGVDDLARMVGKRLEQMAGDNKIARQVAKEFQEAGIVLAGSPSEPCQIAGCIDPCVPPKYYRCAPCLWPCSGYTISPDICSKYTRGTNKKGCHACCDVQWPISSSNPVIFGAWEACNALC